MNAGDAAWLLASTAMMLPGLAFVYGDMVRPWRVDEEHQVEHLGRAYDTHATSGGLLG